LIIPGGWVMRYCTLPTGQTFCVKTRFFTDNMVGWSRITYPIFGLFEKIAGFAERIAL